MLAVSHSNIEKDGYDVTKRKIYPVFKSTNYDSNDLESVRKFLYANSVFALLGDTSEYEKLGVDPEAFTAFTEKYSVFFSVDLQWNFKNAHNQMERFAIHKNLKRFIKELPPEIKSQSSASLCQRIKQEDHTLSFDHLFDIFWNQFLEVVLYNKPFDHLEYARRGIQKYISGQVYVAFLYGDICKSDELINQYKTVINELRSADRLEDILQVYDHFRMVFEEYLLCLEKNGIILADEKKTYTLHVPHFPTIYSGYDNPKDGYETLSEVSKRIFKGKLVRGECFQHKSCPINTTTQELFRAITKLK